MIIYTMCFPNKQRHSAVADFIERPQVYVDRAAPPAFRVQPRMRLQPGPAVPGRKPLLLDLQQLQVGTATY